MPTYVEIIPVSQGLLPHPCPDCLWWQNTQGSDASVVLQRRLDWMASLERTWGSVGLVAMDCRDTVASIQFAPVRALARPHGLPLGPPPDDAVLVYCLRGKLGRPVKEAQQLLHQAMGHLRRRRVQEIYAYARPLGSKQLCGVRNLFGLEFLESSGFQVVRADGDLSLMRVDLRGLLPAVAEARTALRRVVAHGGHPSPATFTR